MNIDVDNIYLGLLINIKNDNILSRWFGTGRHWYSIKEIDGIYYNLDSFLKEPKKIRTFKEV